MSNEDRDPQKKRSSKVAPSLGGLAKSGVSLATDSVGAVVKGAKASGSFVQGTAKTITKASGKAVQGTAKTLNPTNLFKKSKRCTLSRVCRIPAGNRAETTRRTISTGCLWMERPKHL